MIRKPQN